MFSLNIPVHAFGNNLVLKNLSNNIKYVLLPGNVIGWLTVLLLLSFTDVTMSLLGMALDAEMLKHSLASSSNNAYLRLWKSHTGKNKQNFN